jgi:hypothetical protein
VELIKNADKSKVQRIQVSTQAPSEQVARLIAGHLPMGLPTQPTQKTVQFSMAIPNFNHGGGTKKGDFFVKKIITLKNDEQIIAKKDLCPQGYETHVNVALNRFQNYEHMTNKVQSGEKQTDDGYKATLFVDTRGDKPKNSGQVLAIVSCKKEKKTSASAANSQFIF